MKIYHGLSDPNLKKKERSVAVGVFDGVHLGHRAILKTMLHHAQTRLLTPTVVTFDPDPAKILAPKKPHPILITLEHRLSLFESLGVREALVIHFDKKFSKIDPQTYLNEYLIHKIGLKHLVVGHDFKFGRQGKGDIPFLKAASKSLGFDLTVVAPLCYAGTPISSTRIREAIQNGFLVGAAKMLGRKVCVRGTVIRGRGRGKKIGFATANLNPHHETLPPSGVYAVRGRVGKTCLEGVLHLGERPTFGDEPSLEVHFLDFKRNIYGKNVELEFLLKLRNIQCFKSTQTLKQAIEKDIRITRKALLAIR